ncbi:MAG: UDP-glucose 4-epimerase GalE [Lachnospiraceae bacterium]|nr:UDP-glucose 4-epimerase GalE [Lachnospiraceae bacterium]
MSILVVGGAGYIGSHVNKMLARKGFDTVVLDNLVYGHEEAVVAGEFVRGDIANKDDIRKAFEGRDIEAVFHFANYAYVGESCLDPEKYYVNNISNTLNLLSVMREQGCNKIIFSSSCSTYGVPERVPITEDLPQRPMSPYASTKLMIEMILKDYARAYGLRYVGFRYFNACGADPEGEIGESHTPETHLIPITLDVASGLRDEMMIFGNDYNTPDGTNIRDYVHVLDLAEAHIAALDYFDRGGENDFFNIGTEKGFSNLEIVEAVKRVTGRDFPVVITDRRPGDPDILVGSSEKARRVLGWVPKYSDIETVIETAWKWHENKKF